MSKQGDIDLNECQLFQQLIEEQRETNQLLRLMILSKVDYFGKGNFDDHNLSDVLGQIKDTNLARKLFKKGVETNPPRQN